MFRPGVAFEQVMESHRRAAAWLRSAEKRLAALAGKRASRQDAQAQAGLADQLRHAAEALTPGWLGAYRPGVSLPFGRDADPTHATADDPVLLRVGEARLPGGATFGVALPLIGAGHLAVDTDARDRRVAGLIRGLLLRLLAACPTNSLRVLLVDGGTVGSTFAPFQPLMATGVVPPPATNGERLREVLAEAEQHVRDVQSGADVGHLLVMVASLPADGVHEVPRLAALAHAGPAARLYLVWGGYPVRDAAGGRSAPLENTTQLTVRDDHVVVGNPPNGRFGTTGLSAPVTVDPPPPDELIEAVCEQLAEQARAASALGFDDVVPAQRWTDSSVSGLRTVVGRDGTRPAVLAFDDTTPHWLVGGRTGSGKTVFLLDVLYGLAARYSPDELAMYLLDFKEGVSFTEFTPTDIDGSWIPHARAVGIESDREYGVAVLRELVAEMTRRSLALKKAGVTKLADLRASRPDVAMPRVLAVIDEFHVLFDGNDRLAAEAAGLLEDLARKGRSYGVHLILASQTASGVEALYTKSDSIFGQFPMRIALAGASGILHPLNDAAGGLEVGTALVNASGGIKGHNRLVRFPDAHADAGRVNALRQELWSQAPPGAAPPAVFAGYAAQHVTDDPAFGRLTPGPRRWVMVGRCVDVVSSTAAFPLDASPGRHVAVIGQSPVGADVVHAAVAGLAKQHEPGTARFVLAPLVAGADDAATDASTVLRQAGHDVDVVDAAGLRALLGTLAKGPAAAEGDGPGHTYLVVFGVDAASGVLTAQDAETYRTGLDDLRVVLRQGPGRGVHLIGWWRGLTRFDEDLGGSSGREDVACLVALNVPSNDLGMFLGDLSLQWRPRDNRALLADRHDGRTSLIVPFVRPGGADEVTR